MKIKNMVAFAFAILMCLIYGCCTVNIEPEPAIAPPVTVIPTPVPTPTIAVSPTESPIPYTKFADSENFPFPYDTELEIDSSGKMIFSRQQILEDYDVMWEMLEDNYPFFGIIESELGIDYHEIKEEYRAKLLKISENGLAASQFYTQIDSCLKRFNYIGHLFVVSPYNYASTISYPVEIIDNAYKKRMRSVIDSDKVYQTYTHLSGGSLESLFPTIGSDDSGVNIDIEKIEQYLIHNNYIRTKLFDDASYIQINEFLPPEDTNGYGRIMVDMCTNFFRENREIPNLIIDISNNPGGGSMFWMEMVSSLITENTPPYSILQCGKSGAYNQYIWDADKPEGAFSPSDSEWREVFPNVTRDSVVGMDWMLVLRDDEILTPKEDSVQYEGSVWILTGKGTASAAEEFVVFCKETGFATLVGTRTRGSGAGSFPLWFALPNSGLLISYEAYYAFNDDGTCNQFIGTRPDIEVKNGQTALEACLEAIRQRDSR